MYTAGCEGCKARNREYLRQYRNPGGFYAPRRRYVDPLPLVVGERKERTPPPSVCSTSPGELCKCRKCWGRMREIGMRVLGYD